MKQLNCKKQTIRTLSKGQLSRLIFNQCEVPEVGSIDENEFLNDEFNSNECNPT